MAGLGLAQPASASAKTQGRVERRSKGGPPCNVGTIRVRVGKNRNAPLRGVCPHLRRGPRFPERKPCPTTASEVGQHVAGAVGEAGRVGRPSRQASRKGHPTYGKALSKGNP